MTISLIIPAHNEEKYIGSCLECVIKQSDWYIDEIIVIDNASTDHTKEIAESYDNVKVVTIKEKWPTFARQRWYKESIGDILAFIDADTRMPAWRATKLKEQFTQDVGFVSGPYNYYDFRWYGQIGNRIYRRLLAYPMYLICGYLGVWGNFAITRKVLDNINWFDITIAFYGDDTDIARRASKYCKTKFVLSLTMPTSSRRFTGQWRTKTVGTYIINFLSQAIRHKPVTKKYQDFR